MYSPRKRISQSKNIFLMLFSLQLQTGKPVPLYLYQTSYKEINIDGKPNNDSGYLCALYCLILIPCEDLYPNALGLDRFPLILLCFNSFFYSSNNCITFLVILHSLIVNLMSCVYPA